MLARKVGYMHYATSHKTAASGETNRVERRFGTVVMRVVFLVMLFCVFLLSGIALTSMKNNYSYTLSQKKQQVRQLQRDNDALRVRIATLETPERVYSIATKDLGMVEPSYTLYSSSRQQAAVDRMNP